MYCTLEAAKSRGATGSDADIAQAIMDAQVRVDRYTGDTFEPTTDTLEVRVRGDYAPVRRRMQTVASVTAPVPGQAARVIPATAYLLEPHGIRFRAWGSDILVAGAEPWRGGWANLTGPLDGLYVRVTGTFGWVAVPGEVADATALLAADLSPAVWEPRADAEGNPIGVPPAEDDQYRDPAPERVGPAARLERTTGNAEADRLLSAFVTTSLKIG